MAGKWKKFKEEIKLKRTGKKAPNDSREEIVIQRLSSSVSGKAQKYTRVGPREFVDFCNRDLTIDNIKDACIKHFGAKIGEKLVCDVLAGEQGPSCSNTKQIPNLKLIHVRFIEADFDIVEVKCEKNQKQQSQHSSLKRKHHSSGCASRQLQPPRSLPSPKKDLKKKSVPKSLSVSTILKLGRVIESSKDATILDLYSFSLETMTWSGISMPVEFVISTDLLGEGGFRKAYKATATSTRSGEFTNGEWVVKYYKDSAIKEIKEINQTVETQTKKVVQMHYLAQNFAAKLDNEVASLEDGEFGEVMQYNKIFLGKCPDGEVVSVEKFVDGNVTKYINNDGTLCEDNDEVMQKKAECLVHFSYQHSNNEVMLVDVQGIGYTLFDPEIVSTQLLDQNEVMFTTGNLSREAINNFINEHVCNIYCQHLDLTKLK